MKTILYYGYVFFLLAVLSCDNSDDAHTHQANYIVLNGMANNSSEYTISSYKYPSGETNLDAYTFQAEGHFQRDYTLKDDKIYLLRDGLIDVINASTLTLETSKEVSVSNGYDYNRIVVTDSKIYLLGYTSGATVLHRFDRASLADEGATVANNVPEVFDAIALGDKLVIGSTNLYFIDAGTAEVVKTVDLPENVSYLLNGKDSDVIVVHPSKVSIVNGESYAVSTPENIGQPTIRPAFDEARNSIIYPLPAAQPSVNYYLGLYEINLTTMEHKTLISDGAWFEMQINAVQYDARHDVILLAGLGYDGYGDGRLRIVDRAGKSEADAEGFYNPLGVLIPSN